MGICPVYFCQVGCKYPVICGIMNERQRTCRPREGNAITPEEKAWAKDLFLSHSQLMFRVAAYRLGDEERAGDLVQEVFLLLIVKIEQVMTYDNPAGWLFETLRRTILAEAGLRTRRRARELPLEEEVLPASAPLEEAPLDRKSVV